MSFDTIFCIFLYDDLIPDGCITFQRNLLSGNHFKTMFILYTQYSICWLRAVALANDVLFPPATALADILGLPFWGQLNIACFSGTSQFESD